MIDLYAYTITKEAMHCRHGWNGIALHCNCMQASLLIAITQPQHAPS